MTAPSLSGRRVFLRPPAPGDYDWLYPLATTGKSGRYWRLRGSVPQPDAFVQSMWRGVECQMIVANLETSEALGLVQFMNFDARNRHGFISVLFRPEAQLEGWPIEGLLLFVNYTFLTWDLRKLYFESLEPSFDTYRSAVGRVLVEEGCLKGHEYVDGEYVDYHVLALYRETWQEKHEILVRATSVLGSTP